MANFESGVSSYVKAQALVTVYFPVDAKGNADISCSQCYYFRESSKRCGLNWEICAYPNKYVGDSCPLVRIDEDTGEVELYTDCEMINKEITGNDIRRIKK